jgi:type IV secretion system protein VirB4
MDPALREALQPLVGGLFDASSDPLDFHSGLTVIETEELLNTPYAFSTLLYLFQRIDNALRGQPAVIILDEAWLFLDHPLFRQKIQDWLKTLRKKNACLILATQSPADALACEILPTLLQSAPTRIFLPDPNALAAADTYSRLGLSHSQITRLSRAIARQQYYLTTPDTARLFELALGPLAQAVLAVSDRQAVNHLKNLRGPNWLAEWLTYRAVPPPLAYSLGRAGSAPSTPRRQRGKGENNVST